MDWLERDASRLDEAASEYRDFLQENRRNWSPYICGVVGVTEERIRQLEEAYNDGEFYSEFLDGPDKLLYELKLYEIQAEAWERIELGLETKPFISGRVREVIIRPSVKGIRAPLGDPLNTNSIIIDSDNENRTRFLIPLMPEWEEAERGDYVQFFATDKYYRAELIKKKQGGVE